MRTRKNIEGYVMIDSLSFEENPNVTLACDALSEAKKEVFPPFGIITGYTSASDKDDSQIVHIFLKNSDFKRLEEKERKEFFVVVCEKFKKAGFIILKEEDLDGQTYFHVGFYSHHFMLKKS